MNLNRHRNVLLASAGCLALLVAAPAAAQQVFIINTPETTTNGGETVDTGDSLTVTPNGSIDASGTPGTRAISAIGDNVTLDNQGNLRVIGAPAMFLQGNEGEARNSGDIATNGTSGDGQLYVGTSGTLRNSGTMTIIGNNSRGQILSGNRGELRNSGTISTLGVNGHAQSVDGVDGAVRNSGSIATNADGAFGQRYVDNNGRVENSGSIVTNGHDARAQSLLGNDGRITNAGTIRTSGTAAYGQRLFGDRGALENSGSLETSDSDSVGQLLIGDDGTVNNSGSIRTNGGGAYGQNILGNNGGIRNSGSIETGINGDHAQFFNGNGGSVENSGSIKTRGTAKFGQFLIGDNGRTSNSGAVETSGSGAHAQFLDGNNGSTGNSGSIVTRDGVAFGQFLTGDDSQASNTGLIMTHGAGSTGIYVNGDRNIVFNSGKTVSAQENAFYIDGADNTLTLHAPAFIGGNIRLVSPNTGVAGPSGTTVNIMTGPSHSTFWTLEGAIVGGAPNFSGTVPWFYDPAAQTVATFDPTFLSAQTLALGDLTHLLSEVGLSGLGGGALPGAASENLLGYAPNAGPAEAGAYAANGLAAPQDRGAWAALFGSRMDHDGTNATLSSEIGHLGGAVGYRWAQTADLTLSAMAGYAVGDWSANSRWAPSMDNQTQIYFAGLHGDQKLNWGALKFGVTGGYTTVDHRRFINNNLAPLGNSWATADYAGYFVSPEISISANYAMQNGVTITPSAGLRYAAMWLEGYSESGAINPAANATVGDRMSSMVEGHVEIEARQSLDWGELSARAGFLGRWNGGSDATTITLNGITQSVSGNANDLAAGYVGGTVRTNIGAASFMELDGSYIFGDSANGFTGKLTAGISF